MIVLIDWRTSTSLCHLSLQGVTNIFGFMIQWKTFDLSRNYITMIDLILKWKSLKVNKPMKNCESSSCFSGNVFLSLYMYTH